MNSHLSLIAKICAWIGVVCRIVAYQYSQSPHACPEWVFDLDSIGFFIEAIWLAIAAFTNGKQLHEFIVPAMLFAYVVLFDACKEVSGANQSKTGMEYVLFWFFFLLTYLFARHARKTRARE